MLQLKQATLRRGMKTLLDKADLLIHSGEKIGFVGSNGAGKSSLFALLRGELEARRKLMPIRSLKTRMWCRVS